MGERLVELGELLSAVGWRWRRLAWLRAWTLGAAVAAVVLLAGVGAVLIAAPGGVALIALTVLTLVIAGGSLARALWPARRQPAPLTLARLIEERVGGLDDVLVTAVEYAARPDHSPQMARLLAGDAARAARGVDLDAVVSRPQLVHATRMAAAAAFAFAVALVLFLGPLHRAALLTTAYLFPARLTIEVVPGDVKVAAGQPLTIITRLHGIEGGLVPSFVAGGGADDPGIRMRRGEAPGEFTLTLDALDASFAYRVTAGSASSPAYTVTVVYPPRVERIDLQYEYPRAFGLAARTDEDSGDIYAPAGTRVRVAITADKVIAAGALVLDDGTRVPLEAGTAVVDGNLVVSGDGSYRVSLADTDGLENPGETEYFIRVLNDRPPDVRIMRPAGDRQVTALEEVLIEARADDDYGIANFDLVLQTPAGRETVIPLGRGAGAQTASGSHVLYLEELGVEPGDFVTYYARARDVGRGRRPVESRSDIFFLEVKPFEEVFRAAQSQSMSAPGGGGNTMDDLAAVQKEIIVATWKLDARARRANDARSAQDIRTVAKAQTDLKARAEQMAAQARPPVRGRRGAGMTPAAGGEDDAMANAVVAMGRAAGALDQLKIAEAIPHEMEALNHLLKAQAEVRERQVARQQQGGGGGGNRQQADLSSLFDQELRRNQGTNYETPSSAETRDDQPADDPLEDLRELARRQDALNRQQRDLARNRDQMNAEEVKRQLARLTRDQEELRREAEALARQLEQQQRQQAQRPSQSGQRGQSGQSGEGAESQGAQGSSGERLREASQQMRDAAGQLGRENPDEATARGGRALEELRRAEEALRNTRPDERRRTAGDLQLEAQQIAEAQRRLATEAGQQANGEAGTDARRRLAGEQDRLADRAGRLEDAVRQLGASTEAESRERQAVDDAAREIERQRVAERMRQSAEALRGAGPSGEEASQAGREAGREVARDGEGVARALDRVAERLGAAMGTQDAESRRLSEQLARTRELRDRLAEVQRSMERLERDAGEQAQGAGRERAAEGQEGQSGSQGQQAGPGAQGRGGQEGAGGQGGSGERGRLQRETERQMREAQEVAEQLGRDNPGMGGGSTPEGWRASVSAPGTEGFKQDFARWESLKAHLLLAIEQIEGQASEQLRAREARDRLNAGRREAAPDAYRDQVDRYYRSLAAPRKPPQ
ncbi:MAG: hypothetical protein Q8L86_09800 [Vicinamibacterales bacterium]|nr:hypothetical protein [Vicinamibacterales bacterium]